MRDRWLRIGLLAAAVFAINVAGRLVVRIGSIDDEDTEGRVTLITLIAIALVMAIVAVLWARQRPLGGVISELSGAGVVGGLLCLVAGPYLSDTTPFANGLTFFLAQCGVFAAYAGGGALIGVLMLIMVGQDYRSRSLARFAEEKLAKPRRPVRR